MLNFITPVSITLFILLVLAIVCIIYTANVIARLKGDVSLGHELRLEFWTLYHKQQNELARAVGSVNTSVGRIHQKLDDAAAQAKVSADKVEDALTGKKGGKSP